jgi:hypothetical protein
VPAVGLGNRHGPLWTIRLACQMGGRNCGRSPHSLTAILTRTCQPYST